MFVCVFLWHMHVNRATTHHTRASCTHPVSRHAHLGGIRRRTRGSETCVRQNGTRQLHTWTHSMHGVSYIMCVALSHQRIHTTCICPIMPSAAPYIQIVICRCCCPVSCANWLQLHSCMCVCVCVCACACACACVCACVRMCDVGEEQYG